MKRASDNLVKAAQKAAFDKAEDDNVVVKTKFVGGIAQVSPLKRGFIFFFSNSSDVFVIFSPHIEKVLHY